MLTSALVQILIAAGPAFGNVYLEGEQVAVIAPDGASTWRVLNDTLTPVTQGEVGERSQLDLGPLPVGWYRIEFSDASGTAAGFTTAAVLARLPESPPKETPVAVDIALSSLAADDPDAWPALARLAAMAGAGWVRDRIRWRDVEPEPGNSIDETVYDVTAQVQAKAGLQVLQVFHSVPVWARESVAGEEHYRSDLRELNRFCAAMAERFRGKVQAWEPWNEGNARNFGGLTIDELCSLQKAAWLGFKESDPDLTVCWAPIGGVNTPAQAEAILRNETWSYFDVYSIHSYDWPHAYAELWEPARRAACGRPIWVTECDRGMNADAASSVGDFSHEDARRKAAFMAQSYACSLFAGSSRHFHFILGPYTEGQGAIQFGLLRHDYTPRMSYVALAAVGRLLAGARCLGRWKTNDENMHVYAFRGVPDGERRDVLVAWTEKQADWPERGAQSAPWPLPDLPVEVVYDYLGRALDAAPPDTIASSPVFVVLPEGATDALQRTTVEPSEYREGSPSPVVLQFHTPGLEPVIRQRAWTQEPERVFASGATAPCELVVYNFSESAITGSVVVEELPAGWTVEFERGALHVPPKDRAVLSMALQVPQAHEARDNDWVTFRGRFGLGNEPVLAVQVNRPE